MSALIPTITDSGDSDPLIDRRGLGAYNEPLEFEECVAESEPLTCAIDFGSNHLSTVSAYGTQSAE